MDQEGYHLFHYILDYLEYLSNLSNDFNESEKIPQTTIEGLVSVREKYMSYSNKLINARTIWLG